MTIKTENREAYLTIIYPCIPTIPRYGYTVCTVCQNPIPYEPVLPVLETPRVLPYLCGTLKGTPRELGKGRGTLSCYLVYKRMTQHVLGVRAFGPERMGIGPYCAQSTLRLERSG